MPSASVCNAKEGKIYPSDLYGRRGTQPNASLNTDFAFKRACLIYARGSVSDVGTTARRLATGCLALPAPFGQRAIAHKTATSHIAGGPALLGTGRPAEQWWGRGAESGPRQQPSPANLKGN